MTHPLAWLAWLCAATMTIWSSRNPYLLVLLLLIISIVHVAHSQRGDLTPSPAAYWFVPIAALLNALWTQTGDTVLLQFPTSLPLIGDRITAEALAYGALNGLALAGMFRAFAALQRAVPIADMIAVVPRALHPIAVVTIIAVTYVPFARRQARAVRDAQAVRGLSVRGLRDWLPLFAPLLISALEHGMQLAEAMSARGYGRSTRAGGSASQLLLISGLLTVLLGWILQTVISHPLSGWLVTACGAALLTTALWLLRSRAPRTSYRRRKLQPADWVGIAGACLAAVAVVAPLPGADMLAWTPYPLLRWPGFSPIIAVMLCGLCVPALFAARTQHDADEVQP
jgi:energy-coupling factor transport system permease protein